MAIIERTRDYEILIRFNADGTMGAHRQTITEFVRDEEVLSAVPGDPQPVTVEEVVARLQE